MKANDGALFAVLSDMENGEKVENTNVDNVLGEYVEISNKLRKQRNNLLGSFDSEGNYKISDPTILAQILILPKHFEMKEDDVVYATAKITDTLFLNFKIAFEISPEFCNAYLYIIEKEEQFGETIVHTTFLDSKLDIYSPTFKENVYELWRVYLDEEIYEKDNFLKELLLMQKEDYESNFELFEIVCQLFLMRMLKALEGCGELGLKIKQEYNELLEKYTEQDPSFRLSNIKMKLLLERVIEKNGGMALIAKNPQVASVLNGYSNPMKQILSPASVLDQNGKAPFDKKTEKKDEKKVEEQKKKTEPAKAKAKAKGKAKSASKPKPAKAFSTASVFKKAAKKKEQEETKPHTTEIVNGGSAIAKSVPGDEKAAESKPSGLAHDYFQRSL